MRFGMSDREGRHPRRAPTPGRPRIALAVGVALPAVLLGLLLTAGCNEHGAMPTRPGSGSDDGNEGDWQRVYPAVTNQNLRALWGLDADDMWAVGDRGTILHYDGRQVRRFAAGTRADLVAIDGCARDEAWAVSRSGHILRWDGRRWHLVHQLVADLTTVCNPALGDVFVGGRSYAGAASGAAIWQLVGGQWRIEQRNGLHAQQGILRIWSPGAGRPLLAASSGQIWRFAEDGWRPADDFVRFRDADGDLVLVDRGIWFDDLWFTVYRVRPDGKLTELCRPLAYQVSGFVQSRSLVIDLNQRLDRFDDCTLTPLYDTAQSLNDLAVPVLAGRHGPHIFAVGHSARFLRLTWQADLSLDAVDLLPAPESRSVRTIATDDNDLYILDDGGRLFRRDEGEWREIGLPFEARDITTLASGALAIRERYTEPNRFSILPRGGVWQELPPFDRYYERWWIDDALRPRIVRWEGERMAWELWGLEGQSWVRLLDAIGAESQEWWYQVPYVVGFAPDDLYLATVLEGEGLSPLWHYDGTRAVRVAPERDLVVRFIHAGRSTGRLYFIGADSEHGEFLGFLQDGLLTVLDPAATAASIVELGADLVLLRTIDGRLLHLGPAGWRDLRVPAAEAIVAIAGHPACGIFILTDDDVVYHHDPGGETP